MQDILDEDDVKQVVEFVDKQLESVAGTEEEKEEQKAFSTMHYMMCAAAEKKRNGSVGDISKYPPRLLRWMKSLHSGLHPNNAQAHAKACPDSCPPTT